MPKFLQTTLCSIAAGAVLLTLGGCASPTATPDDDARPLVLTTFTVIADIAANVAGDALRVESITKVGAEIHGYEPTPADIRRATGADLILDNGLGLEAWFAQFVEASDAPHVVVSEGIDPVPIAGTTHANPHAWMSPIAAQTYVDNMVAAFGELAPEHAAAFEANGEAYKAELQQVHDELVDALASVPDDHRALVTCEGAFSYLARDTGLEEIFIWPVNAEQQATPRQVAAVVDAVREREIPTVFCESTVSDKPMQQVVSSTGAEFGGVLYVDSLSEAGGPVPTYLDLLRHDVDVIVAGLGGEEQVGS